MMSSILRDDVKQKYKNNIFSYLSENKKKFLPIGLTPLLAACDFSFPVIISPDADLVIGGFTIHHSINGVNDNFSGTGVNDAIIGRDGDDIFYGNGGDDVIYGQDGNDQIFGGSGSDELYGGAGDDFLVPGTDTDYDYVHGGNGNDTVFYSVHSNPININLSSGEVYISGLFADDLVSIENAVGSATASNIIIGNDETNNLYGGNANDNLSGAGGNDYLLGYDGADILIGGDGDDILDGGRGEDTLIGGSGADVFVFNDESLLGSDSNDTIGDFIFDDDKIDFSELAFLNNFANVVTAMTQVGADVIIALNAGATFTVTVENTLISDYIASDFMFIA